MFTLNCRGRLLVITRPLVMGIINTTPDSFFEGSRASENNLLQTAERMLNEGAAMLDMGGQSTRPGSTHVGEEEELARVISAVAAVHTRFPEAIISIDTFYARVAAEAVSAGAVLVNDISGGLLDPQMLSTVAALQTPFICMHMKGNPQTMQQLASYDDIAVEVLDYFIERTASCQKAGIHDVIIDPGFGFAKTIAQNFSLLKRMQVLKMLKKPIMVGLSRKGTVYKTLGSSAAEALNGSTVLHTLALPQGAHILRVHDVKEAVEAITLFCAYNDAD
ncbi:MAG TPA: dihydropteroate synthase [Chitinophagaceae bacterium]|nr:dihydropteroate synthase [Chitinophagaceae bacterium]